MKLNFIKCTTFVLLGLPFYFIATSSSGGITGVSQGGCTCHGNLSANTTVTISPALSSYSAGQKVNFTITVANPNMVTGTSGAGFNLETNIGTLTSLDGETQVIGSEITHTMPKPSSTGAVSWNFRWSAPASGNTPLQMTIAGNAVDGTGGNNNDEWNFGNIPSVPLPVTFTHFSGKYNPDGVELDWQIEDIVNASHFEVQKSFDGLIFNPIATIKINSNKSYNYKDALALASSNSYRIVAYDFDGQYTKSETIVITSSKYSDIKIYPTIVTDGKLMITSHDETTILTAYIYNLSGALIQSNGVESSSIDVSTLTTGVYVIKLEDGSHTLKSSKIIIQ